MGWVWGGEYLRWDVLDLVVRTGGFVIGGLDEGD
jgi:hypothetical protein